MTTHFYRTLCRYPLFFRCFVLAAMWMFFSFQAFASDLVYDFTKRMGGSGVDSSANVAVDSSGNIYVAGIFQDTVDFDPSSGTDNRTSAGNSDIFFSKYDANGTYLWTRTVGGTESDFISGIATDSAGNIYVVGSFQDIVDFDPSSGTDNRTSAGNSSDIFFSTYDANGTYLWTRTVGGTDSELAGDIATDSAGNIYIAGSFRNIVDFDPSSGMDSRISAGEDDSFFSTYDANGTYLWTKTVGGTESELASDIATDSAGNIYVVGSFQDTVDFDPSSGTDNRTSAGNSDSFFSTYDADGTYLWTRTTGGTGLESAGVATTDSSGNIYVAGIFQDTVDFDPSSGTDNRTSVNIFDSFFSKYDADGTYLWTKTVGGTDNDLAGDIATDSAGNIYIVGSFQDTVDFDPSSGTDNRTSAGNSSDIFFSTYDANGTYLWTRTVGGTESDFISGIATDSAGNIYVAGIFQDTVDFDPSSGTDNRTSAGSLDNFFSKYLLDSTPPTLSVSLSSHINTSSVTLIPVGVDSLAPILSIEYQLDSGVWTPCSPEDSTYDEQEETALCSLSNLSEGSHILLLRVTDGSNNTSSPLTLSFVVDFSAPSSPQSLHLLKDNLEFNKDSVKKETRNYTREQKPFLRGKNTDARNGTATIFIKPDRETERRIGETSIDENGKWKFKLLQKKEENTLRYRVVFTDKAGNASSSSAFKVTRDWTKPVFIEKSLPSTLERNQTVTFIARDRISGIKEYKVSFVKSGQNADWKKDRDGTFTVPSTTPPGFYYLSVRATDKAGNRIERGRGYWVR